MVDTIPLAQLGDDVEIAASDTESGPGGLLAVRAGNSDAGAGGAATLAGGTAAGTNNDGGAVTIAAGLATGGGAAGGSIAIIAGEATGTNSDGGEITVTGGPSATGDGGHVTFTAGIGEGAGGSIEFYAGAASDGNGGSLLLTAGAGTDAAGLVEITAGNASASDGGNIEITAGNGTDGDGGNVRLAAGTGDIDGNIILYGLPTTGPVAANAVWSDDGHLALSGAAPATYPAQGTPTAKTADATLTIAELLTNLITVTSATAVALTLPTGTLTDAGIIGGALADDRAFEWVVMNEGSVSGVITFVESAGHTIIGPATLAILMAARFRTRKTAADTFVTYRIG